MCTALSASNPLEGPTSSVTIAGTKSTKLVTDSLPPIRFYSSNLIKL